MSKLSKIHANTASLIIGLGVTGLSCARYFTAHNKVFSLCDTRQSPPNLAQVKECFPEVDLYLGELDWAVVQQFDQLVVSPGLAMSHPVLQQALAADIAVVGDIELFAQAAKQPIVAITGSNGKSTVTTCVAQMVEGAGLQVGVGGNLGMPVLDLLRNPVDIYVLELSSFQLETTFSLSPAVAVVLNISEDHMDRYEDLAGYISAKAKVYAEASVCLLNKDDAAVMVLKTVDASNILFTLGEPDEGEFGMRVMHGEAHLCQGQLALMKASALLIPGRHNVANALASLALGQAVGLDMSVMVRVLGEYSGLAHRTQFVTNWRGITFYNDSKATNVGASVAALKGLSESALDKHIVLIAGGDAKDADFSEFSTVVEETVKSLVLIGRDAPLIEQKMSASVVIFHAEDMQQAVQIAAQQAKSGDAVLLSPACASFDMYSGFVERGNVFVQAVEAWVA